MEEELMNRITKVWIMWDNDDLEKAENDRNWEMIFIEWREMTFGARKSVELKIEIF